MSEIGVARNIEAYRKRASKYEHVHGEIFNEREQKRLRAALSSAADSVRSDGRHALDYGCGSGNLARHMLDIGLDVTCADVSPEFLRLVDERFGVPTIELVDGSTSCILDGSVDIIGLYSVLHHIPDYLSAVTELFGKLRPGGVLMIDHERNNNYWHPTPQLLEFRRENQQSGNGRAWDPGHKRWQHLVRAALVPSRHLARYQRIRRISLEGDIHVYADDNVDWSAVVEGLTEADAELVQRTDYLHFEDGYDEAAWLRWRDQCDDMTCVIARRAV
jgi:ubiquinone/menaquinone biosynthesis C-methylase UbiE